MKGFLYHESCPNCGSKDNLARYSDGSAWCFGCHYRERRTRAPDAWHSRTSAGVPEDVPEHPRQPEDGGTSFAAEAVEWLGRFHLDVPTAIRRGVLWSPSRRQLIYQMGNVWQARNFNMEPRPDGKKRSKNFTSGDVNECLHIFAATSIRRDLSGTVEQVRTSAYDGVLVLVEDPVSAIRIGALCDSMPLLGSHLATSRLNAVARLYKAVVVWLDSDKLKEARNIAERFKLVGVSVKVIYTEQDPKCYTNEQLLEIL